MQAALHGSGGRRCELDAGGQGRLPASLFIQSCILAGGWVTAGPRDFRRL